MLTKGAIGNLVNRYRAVLTKCNLINTFGSLAVASMLVLGGAGVAGAATYGPNVKDDKPTPPQTSISTKGGANFELNVDKEFIGDTFTQNGIINSDRNEDGGGAIYTSKTLTLDNCIFDSNYVSGSGYGGALYVNGGTLIIKNNSKFSDNHGDSYGGAIASMNAADVQISNTVFENNRGTNGGALYFRNDKGTGTATFDTCQFIGNKAQKANAQVAEDYGRGGAIQASYGTAITFKGNNLFEGNVGGNGGAISVHYRAGSAGTTNSITFVDGEATFKNNTAIKSGGAIHCDNDLTFGSGSTVTFDGNHAALNGGAIANSTDDMDKSKIAPTTTFEGAVKFINNTSDGEGGAIYNPEKGTVAFNDATFSGNEDKNGMNDIHNDGTLDVAGTTTLDGGITSTNTGTDEAPEYKGTITGSGSLVFTNTYTKVQAQEIDDTIEAVASEALNDKLGGDVEAFKKQIGDKFNADNITMKAGMTAPGYEDGKQSKNEVMDAALQQASVTMVSLDKILTNDVRKRLGDIRSDKNTTGVWMRWDGGKLKGDSGLTNNFNTIQIGGDTKAAKNCRIGFAGSFTHGDMDFNLGGGELEGFSFALYGTWMGENGMFADVVARLGKFSTEMVGNGRTGDMDNRVASLSAEYGWRLPISDQFFVEPQMELAYTYVSSDDLQLGAAKYEFDSVDSLTGRAGVVAGWNLPDERGNVYARASVVQQFMGDAKISGSVNGKGNIQEIDGEDTWLEYGIGANVKLSDSTYLWADVERTEGADIEEEWRGTVGVRFSF